MHNSLFLLDCIVMTLGDGICDMDLNSEMCEYDYGDCCPNEISSFDNLMVGEEPCYEIIVVGPESEFMYCF